MIYVTEDEVFLGDVLRFHGNRMRSRQFCCVINFALGNRWQQVYALLSEGENQ